MTKIKRNNIIIVVLSVVINILILAFFECFFYPMSETGDDSVMMVISSGGFGIETGYVVYINAIIGYVISILNRIVPLINWYNAIQVLLIFSSLLIITLCNLKKFGKLKGTLVSLAFLLIIGYECYVRFQFSKTAGILICAAGYLYLSKYGKNIRIYDYIIIGLLSIISSMIRWELFLIGVGASIAGILWISFCFKVFDNIEWNKLLKMFLKAVAFFAIVFMIGFVFRLTNQQFYSGEEWNQYTVFNSSRSKIRDYPILGYEGNEELYSEIGMSENDYNTLLTWNINDPDFFTTERLLDVSRIANENQTEGTYSYLRSRSSLVVTIKTFIKTYLYILMNYNSFRLLVIMIIITGLIAVSTGKYQSVIKWLLTVAVAILIMMSVLFYIYINDRYGLNRIDITIVMMAILIVLSGTESPDIMKFKTFVWSNVSVFIIVLLYLFLVVFPIYCYFTPSLTEEETYTIEKYQEAADLINMANNDNDQTYFIDTSSMFQGMGYDYWKHIPFGYCRNAIWLGGWYTNSPISRLQQSNIGIVNPYRTLAFNDTSLFITSNDNNNYLIILEYLKEHYNINTCVTIIKRYNYYSIYNYYIQE